MAQDARINILEGSVRSGKTVCMIPKTLSLIHHGPEGLGLFTGVSKDTIYDNVLRDLFDVVGEKNYDYNRQSGDLRIFGDDWKVIGSKDEGSEKYVRGKTIAKAVADELTLMPESFFKMLLTRMSAPGARFYGTTNADNPAHYLYREYITDAAKKASGMVWTEHFDLDDNPNLTEEYKRFIRSAYSGVFYDRFVLGLWVVAEGVIYRDCWSDDLLFDDSDVGEGLLLNNLGRYVGVDYGTSNPMVFGDYLDDGVNLWRMREYYWDSAKEMRQKTDSQYADDFEAWIKEKAEWGQPQVIIDPSAASFKLELINRGYLVIDADNDVENGIRMTSSMMQLRRLRIHRACENWIRERGLYAWDSKKSDVGKDQPLKRYDHTMDETRYVVKTMIPEFRLMAEANL